MSPLPSRLESVSASQSQTTISALGYTMPIYGVCSVHRRASATDAVLFHRLFAICWQSSSGEAFIAHVFYFRSCSAHKRACNFPSGASKSTKTYLFPAASDGRSDGEFLASFGSSRHTHVADGLSFCWQWGHVVNVEGVLTRGHGRSKCSEQAVCYVVYPEELSLASECTRHGWTSLRA